MRNNLIFSAIGLLVLAALAVFLFQILSDKAVLSNKNTSQPQVISVDTIAQSPGNFKGPISVSGTVIRIDQPNTSFTLGCSDACISIPVIYNGKSPKVRANIIVSGQVQDVDGKYIFEGQDVKQYGK